MSKSKGNVVDPDDMIAEVRRRRAAALRDVRRAAGEGSRVDRHGPRGQLPVPEPRLAHRRSAHAGARRGARPSPARHGARRRASARCGGRRTQTIGRVTRDIDPRMHLNTAISALMELVNELYAFGDDRRQARPPSGREDEPPPVVRRAGETRPCCAKRRGARADAVAVRAAPGRGAVGAARPRGRRRRGRLAGVRCGGGGRRGRSRFRCRSTARCAAASRCRPDRRRRGAGAPRWPTRP